MPSFNSLYGVRSGLFAQRRALEVIGQNVANAGTAGYTRQEVSFAATEPNPVIQGGGRGISEVNVLRYRTEFLDRQYRARVGGLGYHEARSRSLAQVEQIVGDLSEGGLRTAMDDFFNAWETLSLRPADTAGRIGIVQAAQTFLGMARTTHQELAALRFDLDEAAGHKVAEINSAVQQVAELNQEILTGELNQQQANELRDRRDMLLDSLARLAGTTQVLQGDGTVTVHLGSLQVVDKAFAFQLDSVSALEPDLDPDPALDSARQFLTSITWNGTGLTPRFGGEMAALVETRDQVIPEYMKFLDNLVRTVATEVNAAHNAGVPAGDQIDIFEVDPDWMAIRVNAAVAADPDLIRAGTGTVDAFGVFTVAPGDGERALAIGRLRAAAVLTGEPVGSRMVTPGEYLRTMTTRIGLQVQQALRRSDAAGLQVSQAELQRQSLSGVSLDDEMTKMIQYQQAYNAAARVMTTIDEMIDVVVNRMGLAGR